MKINLTENEYGFWVELNPENIKEASMLLRMATKSNVSTLEIDTSFSHDINTFISIKKKKGNNDGASLITNGKLKRW